MRRLLFVDDEPRVLDGLRRAFRHRRDHWEMVFATGAAEAIDACGRLPFDVVVTDMRMPDIDGAALLGIVAQRWPGTVRIVLSGQTAMMAALRASQVAHQFLSKPCDREQLEAVLERACRLRDVVTDPRVEAIVGGMDALPVLPAVYQRLTAVLGNSDASLRDVTHVILEDPVLSARVLQLANSSFFAPAQEVTSIERGVSLIGTRVLQSLAMVHGVFHALDGSALPAGFDGRAEQAHATGVAALARRLAERSQADAAFTAGLLHDIGRLVLATRAPEAFTTIRARAVASRVPPVVAEAEVLGVTHSELGAYLLSVWGIPWEIIDAVHCHHDPMRAEDSRGLPLLIHACDALVRETGPMADDGVPIVSLDVDALAAAGQLDAVESWREAAARLTVEVST